MRTTIQLPDELLLRAKKVASDSNRTLTSLIEEAVRSLLSQPRRKSRATALPTFGEGGTLPGVDLDDSAALLDLMERSGDPD